MTDPRSFYGIAWRGMPGDNLRYAVPKTGRLFVVFLQSSGVVQLQPGETALAASTTDAMFVEQGSATAELDLPDPTQVKTNALTRIGQGYVVQLSTSK